MMDELPPDPGPVIEPHSLFKYGKHPDGQVMVACVDCNGIVGTAPDKLGAMGVAGAHEYSMRS